MPSIKLDDILRRFAANTRDWHRESPGKRFAAAAREVTGTPDTYVDHTGAKRNVAEADYGPTPFMLGDVYAGERTVRGWGAEALPDMVKLTDARVLGGWHLERHLAQQPLTPQLTEKIVAAAVQTDDVRQAGRIFTALINNPSLDEGHRRALLDWTLRRTEARDVVDPSTGKLVRPKLSSPPRPEELIARLQAQADPGFRGYAPVLAKAAGVRDDVLRRTVLVAMADPNPSVRRLAAPLLWQVDPPSRDRLKDLIDTFFSADAKAKVRREIEAEVGPLPPNPDLEGDVVPRGDFWPSRMQNAAELRAEFLGTMLQTAPPGSQLGWLIEQAIEHGRGIPGTVSDLFAALERHGASPAERADALVRLNDFSEGTYGLVMSEALKLVALDPALAPRLARFLPPEVANAAPAALRAQLEKTDAGLTALLRTGQLPVAQVLPKIDAKEVGGALLLAALEAGAPPKALLDSVLKNLSPNSGRATFVAALRLLEKSQLSGTQLDAAVTRLLSAPALLGYGVNDNDTRGVPGPPMPGDPVDPPFAPPAGTLSQAILAHWMAAKPSSARVETVATAVLGAAAPDAKAWYARELLGAGAKSPVLERAAAAAFDKLKTDAMAHASGIGDFIEPGTGSANLGDIEADLVAAARAEFLAFKPDAAPAIDLPGALAAARAAPVAERGTVLWQKLSATASANVQAMPASSAVALAHQLPEAQGRPLLNELLAWEADRIAAVQPYWRHREAWGNTAAAALFNFNGQPTLLSAQAVVDFANKAPELKPHLQHWLTQPAAKAIRADVVALLPELGNPLPSNGRPYVGSRPHLAGRLPSLGATAELLAALDERLAKLNDVNARLAANPNSNDLVFEQLDVQRSYLGEVFKLAETLDIARLRPGELQPHLDALGAHGKLLGFSVALHQGKSYPELAAQFHGMGGFDWEGADAVLRRDGPEAAVGHLLLSGDPQTNPRATMETTSLALAAAGRASAPEELRKKLLVDGLMTDPLYALKGVVLWSGRSLDWAVPALTEVMAGTEVQNSDYIGELQGVLPALMKDRRLSNEKVVDLTVGLLSAAITGGGWNGTMTGEEVVPAPIVAAALSRPGLTADQRKTLINAAVYTGRWPELKGVLTAPEYQALADHALARAWKTPLKPITGAFESLLRASEYRATLPPDAGPGMI